MAAASIANIVKSSLGPVGLDKMLVDDIGVNLQLFCDTLHLVTKIVSRINHKTYNKIG